MADPEQLSVRNDQDQGQYVLEAGDTVLGLAQYQIARDGGLAFVHTEIAPAVEGQGLGGVLVKAALDDARARGLAVLPYCTFVRHYMETHPEYLDLIPSDRRPAFGFNLVLPQDTTQV